MYLCFQILWKPIVEIVELREKKQGEYFCKFSDVPSYLPSSRLCIKRRHYSDRHKFDATNEFVCVANVIYKSIPVLVSER